MSTLTLNNISKIYPNGFKGAENVSFSIKDKEFLVLVGPSGCGKSTTLRMIAGLEEASSGEIYIKDKLVNNLDPKDRDIAMVFQNYALYPHMSVFDNLAFSLKVKKLPKSEIKSLVESTAKRLELSELLNRKPRELSGGQRQRVALGRAIVRKPILYLMDEPLSNLDAKLRVQMRSEIIKLFNEGNSSVVYVTHDQTEAMTMGSRIVVMNNGVINQLDTPENIYNNPKNVFVASFIGSPQMNLLNGKVIDENNTISLLVNNITISLPLDMQNILRKKSYINKDIIIGVRPEDIELVSSTGENTIESKVSFVEILGYESYIHSVFSKYNLITRCFKDISLKLNDSIFLKINSNKLHIFDQSTEENILF